MNPLVEKAFQSLTNICNRASLHPNDEDRVKVTLKTLYKNGVPIDIDALENWLINNHWQKKPISNVVSWAQAITSGGRVQLKNKDGAQSEAEVWKRLNA